MVEAIWYIAKPGAALESGCTSLFIGLPPLFSMCLLQVLLKIACIICMHTHIDCILKALENLFVICNRQVSGALMFEGVCCLVNGMLGYFTKTYINLCKHFLQRIEKNNLIYFFLYTWSFMLPSKLVLKEQVEEREG